MSNHRLRAIAAGMLLLGATLGARAQSRPFPQHVTYRPGTIRPTSATQAQADQAVRTFYDAWKARYLRPTAAGTQYYIDVRGEVWQPGAVSVSEGHGYGMVIVAYMAGHDPAARTCYDGLYRFFRAHPAYAPQLMGWYQRLDGAGNVVDGERWNATDGDLDIAYSLLVAHVQWGSGGAINYLQEARNVIAAIMSADINRTWWSVLRGDTGQADQDARMSDFMLDHFRAFQWATGDANWSRVVDKCLSISGSVQSNHSPSTGLLPDFVVDVGSTPAPSPAHRFEGEFDGHYFYNACRTPWRLGTDYLASGDARLLPILQRMNTFIRNATGGNPGNVAAGYRLDGSAIAQYQDLAFIAPLAVSAMAEPVGQAWLDSLWSYVVGLPLSASNYFGNNIKMLCLLVVSGNWWTPQGAANAAPTVALTSPAPGATFQAPATIALAASASDPGGAIAHVRFYRGTTLLGTDATAPYGLTWSNVAAGTYTLTAQATDNLGAVTTSAAVTIQVATATTNRVANPGFEQGTASTATSWQFQVWNGPVTFAIDTATRHGGTRSVRLTGSASTRGGAVSQGNIAVAAGASYTVSGWVKTGTGSGWTSIQLDWYDASARLLSTWEGPGVTSATAWRSLSGTAVAPPGAGRGGGHGNEYFPGSTWFDDVSVVQR